MPGAVEIVGYPLVSIHLTSTHEDCVLYVYLAERGSRLVRRPAAAQDVGVGAPV